jgi:hypothetical protein
LILSPITRLRRALGTLGDSDESLFASRPTASLIAVIVSDFQGDWLETASMLCGLSWQVSFDIEPHLLDDTQDRSGFVAHVFKTGEVIYKAA